MASTTFITVLAVVFGSAALLRITYSWLLPKPISGIHHNPIRSIWGDIPTLSKTSKGGKRPFMDVVRDVVSFQDGIAQVLLGRQPLVVILDIKETERLLLDSKVTELSKRVNQAFAIVIPNSQISMATDETWRRHRRLAGPSMSKRYLERMSTRISAGANNLVKLWGAKMDILGVCAFDATLDIQLATMDNIVNLTMGSPLGCVESAYDSVTARHKSHVAEDIPPPTIPPLYRAINKMMESIEVATKAPFPSLYGRFLKLTSASWRKEYKTLSSFLNDRLSEARQREIMSGMKGNGLFTDADCVLDMIIQREAREGAEAFGAGAIHDELMAYVFAGQDTTAALLQWLVKYLPQDVEIQHRLHDEVCGVFGKGDDTNESLDFNLLDDSERLPLLEAVVAETLRCAGVGAQISRELTQDEVILGRFVPKGTGLLFATALMSRDKERWGQDADEWRPTRWLTPDGAFNRSAGPSFPFGLGQRSCFGQRLATLQVKIYTAALSRNFFFKPVPPGLDNWEAFETITKQPEVCYILLERWEQK